MTKMVTILGTGPALWYASWGPMTGGCGHKHPDPASAARCHATHLTLLGMTAIETTDRRLAAFRVSTTDQQLPGGVTPLAITSLDLEEATEAHTAYAPES